MAKGVREFGETTGPRVGRKGEAGGRGEAKREAQSKGESQLGASEGESSRNLTVLGLIFLLSKLIQKRWTHAGHWGESSD